MFRKPKTRFTQVDEFYGAIRMLIKRLERDGHGKDSEMLDALMHTAWTTGSEALGELMLALQSMKGKYSPESRNEIKECLEFARHHRSILRLDGGSHDFGGGWMDKLIYCRSQCRSGL